MSSLRIRIGGKLADQIKHIHTRAGGVISVNGIAISALSLGVGPMAKKLRVKIPKHIR